jgi:predicted transposase YdaD
LETAKKLLQKGISIEDIADVTGLTIEEVKALDFL